MDTLKKIIAEAFKYKYISESAVEWIGGHPWDDDLFHKNAETFGLSVEQEFISVRGKSLEFDYVVLNTPTVFYHATPKENVEKIKKELPFIGVVVKKDEDMETARRGNY